MEPIGASDLLVIIHLVAWHFKHVTNAVVKLAGMLVSEIVAYRLVCKERAFISKRKVLMLKERVEFIDCTFAWV